MIPADFRQLFTNGEKGKTNGHTERLLNWRVVQSGISWGLVFLLGGGFALAFGIQVYNFVLNIQLLIMVNRNLV